VCILRCGCSVSIGLSLNILCTGVEVGGILCRGVEGGGILCRGVEGCVRVGKFPREIGLHEKVCIIAVINFGFSAQIKRTSCV
jgi:hypothetical protein